MKLLFIPILAILGGCQAAASLNTAGQAAPGVLNNIEMLKADIVTAPIMGCVQLLQGVQGQLNNLKTGTPGVPMAPVTAGR